MGLARSRTQFSSESSNREEHIQTSIRGGVRKWQKRVSDLENPDENRIFFSPLPKRRLPMCDGIFIIASANSCIAFSRCCRQLVACNKRLDCEMWWATRRRRRRRTNLVCWMFRGACADKAAITYAFHHNLSRAIEKEEKNRRHWKCFKAFFFTSLLFFGYVKR